MHKHDYMYPVHIVSNVNLVSDILCRLLDGAEVGTPPDPGVVRGHVGWVGEIVEEIKEKAEEKKKVVQRLNAEVSQCFQLPAGVVIS